MSIPIYPHLKRNFFKNIQILLNPQYNENQKVEKFLQLLPNRTKIGKFKLQGKIPRF